MAAQPGAARLARNDGRRNCWAKLGDPLSRAAGEPCCGPRGRRLGGGFLPGTAQAEVPPVVVLRSGFSRALLPDRRADRGAARVGEGRLRQADPHDVPRGEQLGRRRCARCSSRASPTASSSATRTVAGLRPGARGGHGPAAPPERVHERAGRGRADPSAGSPPVRSLAPAQRHRAADPAGARAPAHPAELGSARRLPRVALDKNQIEQVVVNVLRNAMESIGQKTEA